VSQKAQWPARWERTGQSCDTAPGERAQAHRIPNPEDPSTEELPEFLSSLPPDKPGKFGQMLHSLIEAGCRTPVDLIEHAEQRYRDLARTAEDPAALQHYLYMLERIERDRRGALQAAAWAISREDLPAPIRRQLADARDAQYRPTSDGQRGLLRRLGYDGPVPSRWSETGELIDWVKAQRSRGGRP